jgi:CysZ protein
MISNPFAGVIYFLQGLGLIFRPGLRRYVMIPLVVNVLLFGGLIWFGGTQFEALMDWFMPELPEWLQWLEWLLWLLFVLSALLILFFAFTLLANIIAAPFNGLLAEAVERHLTGKALADDGDWKKLVKEFLPTLLDELRKVAYFIAWSIPFLVLFVIPVVNMAAPILWLAFSAWMLALEYGDYPMGNHGLRAKEQKQRLGQKRLLSLGFGGAVSLATMTPILNFLVMPAAVAGATILWHKQLRGSMKQP